MRPIGFSTGAVNPRDVRGAVQAILATGARAIELSALREEELDDVLAIVGSPLLASFDYVALHAPTRLRRSSEAQLVDRLTPLRDRSMNLVVHPGLIRDDASWSRLGSALCIENMDKRKPEGRTADELTDLFERLPSASFCFDIGHARQVDPTMGHGAKMLQAFGNRLRQLHVSDVNVASRHVSLSHGSLVAFRRVLSMIPADVPLIIESIVPPNALQAEYERTREAFQPL